MAADAAPYGSRNPDAPEELALFEFLLGRWECVARVKQPDGTYRSSRAEWRGRYVLDGHAVADEFRLWDASGRLTQIGWNVRTYSRERRRWVMGWHDALAGTWLELAPEELGGVESDAAGVRYRHHAPPGIAGNLVPAHAIFRVSYAEITPRRFTWRAELSRDGGETWEEVQVIEATRAQP
jgi:hypothetical protein